MRLGLLVVPLILVTTTTAYAGLFDCSNTAPRHAGAPLTGVSHITVIGRAGDLKVTGRRGLHEVTATGTACADDKETLNQIQFGVRQNGSDLRIEAVIPDRSSSFFDWNGGASLDMEVIVPDSMAIDIEDGSGETTVENVGPLRMVDGSGELTIRGVHGNANVHDGSGALTINDVAGSVTIDDGSGSITVRNVQHNVTIESDGSGSVDVTDVRGDFTVENKGSGSIGYARIGGKVAVPRRSR